MFHGMVGSANNRPRPQRKIVLSGVNGVTKLFCVHVLNGSYSKVSGTSSDSGLCFYSSLILQREVTF